jgi:hypothetical protein
MRWLVRPGNVARNHRAAWPHLPTPEKPSMRICRSVLVLGGTALGLSSCAGRIAHQQFYAAKYGVSLVDVSRPTATKQRYGATTAIVPGDSSRYAFEDGLIAVQIGVLHNGVRLNVRNKGDHSMKLIWDETSFIDLDGTLSRVMHIGVKYADRNMSQPPTVIPAQQRLGDDVFPTNRVWYRPPSPRLPAGYQNGPLLKPAYAGGVVQAGEPMAAPDSFATVVRAQVGRRFAVVIPFEVDGVKNEYTFWFKVDDAAVKPLEQP